MYAGRVGVYGGADSEAGLGVGSSVPASAVDGAQRIDELVVKYGVAARTLNIFLGSTMSEGRLDAVIMRLDRIASEDGGRKTKALTVASAGKRRAGASATDSRIVAVEDLLEVSFGGEGGGGYLSSLSLLSSLSSLLPLLPLLPLLSLSSVLLLVCCSCAVVADCCS